MARSGEQRQVFCYHCGHSMDVGGRAMSMPCSVCNKTVLIEDVVVKSYQGVHSIETCGKLIVKKKGKVVAQSRVVAHGGIDLEGSIHCPHALVSGLVRMGPKSEWRGDLRATALSVAEGAKILRGSFVIPDDPLDSLRKQAKNRRNPPPDKPRSRGKAPPRK